MNNKPNLKLAPLYSQLQIIDCFVSKKGVEQINLVQSMMGPAFSTMSDTPIAELIIELDPSLDIPAYHHALSKIEACAVTSNQLHDITKSTIRCSKEKNHLYSSNSKQFNSVVTSHFNAAISHSVDSNLRDLTDQRQSNAQADAERAHHQFSSMNMERD
ncbi:MULTISPECIES: hypothetical protein [Vibrio]|uniref:Uncharacterized protein n=1 Tax=Vibrio tasmaniensis TaxID=212663 RepID=A0A2N7NNF6_9VIBR|nr:hypothetical protein [Vibrio tasmaniensis]PMO80309.1 hypothetical protein BCT01_08440 [Vibrio tasmaniensis]PMP17823.1 hypothetical protein BCS92_05290 [Vibrio tasmaniensis]TKG29028.1 hypothetical protein FC057_20290 [Vibrio tasmaniensis]TKG41573.1 hypothetical protein FC063_06860 [Vibrio tasmaniensis]TKG46222.1 hypothetical protein FC070_22325 [Vibrio tasmaniensis]